MTASKPSLTLGRDDAGRLTILGAAWSALFLAVDPRGQFPLNDDFQYAECARRLLAGEGFHPPQWALSSTATHAALGAVMTAPWGATNQALRAWMIVLGGLGAAGVYALARRWRASPDAALLAALSLALSPLWAAMSASFHIDVTASVFILAALGAFLRGRENDSTAWLAASSVLIALSGLARQTGFLCAFGAAAALASERRLTARTAAALLLPAGAAAAGYWSWLRFVHGPTWALASGAYTPRLAPSYWERVDVWGTVFGRASKAVQTGALCLVPLALLRAPEAVRRRVGRGEAAALALIVGAALIGWYFAGGLPLIANTLTRSGLGAVTLPGADAKPGGWWSSPVLWHAAALLALIASVVLARAAAEDGAGPCGGELRAAAFFVGTPFAAMLLMPALYDRYLLTLLPAAAAAFAAGRRDAGRRLLPAFAAAAVLGLWSAAGLNDYFAWNRARWDAGMAAVRLGVPPESVEDGFDWDGEFSLTRNLKALLARKAARDIGVWDWERLNREMAETTFAGKPDSAGWVLVARFPYRSPLVPRGGEVRLFAAPSLLHALPRGYPRNSAGGILRMTPTVSVRLRLQQDPDLLQHALDRRGGKLAGEAGAAGLPIQAFQLIGEDHSGRFQAGGERDFEGVALGVRGEGAEQGEARLAVVAVGRNGQGRAMARLFVTSLGAEGQPDHVSALRTIRHHQLSRPTGAPQSSAA